MQRNKERYEKNELNMSVMHCKAKMCEIMFLVMDMQNDIRISKVLAYFKDKLSNINWGGSFQKKASSSFDRRLRKKGSSRSLLQQETQQQEEVLESMKDIFVGVF